MAYQPKSYRKFVATAATATLVAGAIAPLASAASFTDVAPQYKEAVDFVVSKGAQGLTETKFGVNENIKRVDAAVLLVKVLGLDIEKAPAAGFTDVPERAVKYVNALKAAGITSGKSATKFGSDQLITRGELAVWIQKGFQLEGQSDVNFTDVPAQYTAAVGALVANEITKGKTATQFGTNDNAKRGDYAIFLMRADKADSPAVQGSVKAINNTTVEVTYKEEVSDIEALDFSIEGLKITNAAVKQTNNKVVVLTTEAQTADKEYTVKSGETTLGKFKGISAVIPTSIKVNNASVQGVVGKEVTLQADIGVKQAGVAVTFNIDSANNSLNKDIVAEAVTDANGIATYSYTQYNAGFTDEVAVYPTGAPAVRSLSSVYWGVSPILTVAADDKKENSLNNGENKLYKVTYKDPKTGQPVANQKLHVTFAENVGVTVDKVSPATVNGVNPVQLSNGTPATTAVVTTDSKGEATFTVSGTNTEVTPVVFLDQIVNQQSENKWNATKLQSKADKLTFGAVQASYDIQVTREGAEEAATGVKNGREYKVVLKTKDGKVAANEIVNLAFNEDIDRVISTNTSAYFVEEKNDVKLNAGKTITVKTDSKGEAKFTIASENVKDYATPIAWIDINSSDAKKGVLDNGEPNKVAPISYFAEPKLVNGVLKAYNGTKVVKEDKHFTGLETATFKYTAANQSGEEFTLPAGYSHIDATFTVFNTGSNDVKVGDVTISPNRSYTVPVVKGTTPSIDVKSVDNKTTSVRVEAHGTAIPVSGSNKQPVNLGSYSAKASFVSTAEVGKIHTGVVESIDRTKEEIKFVGKDKMSYKGAVAFKNVNGVGINQSTFEDLVDTNKGKVVVTVSKDANDKYTFEIVSLDGNVKDTLSAVNSAQTAAELVTALEKATLSPDFKQLKTDAQKTAVANSVLTSRNNAGGELSEIGFKNAYAAAYNAQVTAAVTAVKDANSVATVKTAIKNVPGLDLTGVTSTNETAVYTALESFTGTTLESLQTAVANAIKGLDSAAKLKAVNDATTNEELLTALKALPEVDLTDFNKAPARVQQLVLADVIAKKPAAPGYTNASDIKQEIRLSLDANKDKTSVAIDGITFTAVNGATPATLTINLSDEVDLPATVASADIDGLGISFVDGQTLGTNASAAYDETTTTLTVTLGSDSNIKVGNVLKSIKINDKFGLALDLTAKKADGTTLVSPTANLTVK
ncbi:S-layer homology domain-containing protein [Bacillus sp. JJ722]|uniref:S-layer homology domain-containing protein n=1 Tax=Bacillus sp. JJ722 TaxID=3122973 RepID=UPI002FFF394D